MFSYAVLKRRYDELKEKHLKSREHSSFLEIENEMLNDKIEKKDEEIKELKKEMHEKDLLLLAKVDIIVSEIQASEEFGKSEEK